MTRFGDKSFSVLQGTSKAARDGWERTFGKREQMSSGTIHDVQATRLNAATSCLTEAGLYVSAAAAVSSHANADALHRAERYIESALAELSVVREVKP